MFNFIVPMLNALGHFLDIQSILVQLKNLNDKIRNKNINIAIFGTGGVGKTVVGLLLSKLGEKDLKNSEKYLEFLEELANYNRSKKSEYKSFKSESNTCTLVIAPGQEKQYKDEYWEPIYKDIKDNKVQGLINIVAWGYNSPYSFKHIPQLKKFESILENTTRSLTDKELKRYLEDNRKEELKRIESLVDEICNVEKLWMITVIAKEDLWWNKKSEVINYYKKGEYNSFIEEIKKRMKRNKFHHEYVSVSLLINNLITGDENEQRCLALSTTGYTTSLQAKSMRKLLKTINSCLDKFKN